MGSNETSFVRDPKASASWEAALEYAKSVDEEAVNGCGSSAFDSLLSYEDLTEALNAGGIGAEQDAMLAQVREVLVNDLEALKALIAGEASGGSVPLGNGDAVPGFEVVDSEDGPRFIARGPLEPRNADDRLTPYWRVQRLADSGVMFDLGYTFGRVG